MGQKPCIQKYEEKFKEINLYNLLQLCFSLPDLFSLYKNIKQFMNLNANNVVFLNGDIYFTIACKLLKK